MRRFLVLAVAVLVMLAAACGDDGGTTTTDGNANVIIGSGEIPDSVPEDFPFPAGSLIGSTLVDRINTRTEVEVRTPAQFADVVQFWNINLVNSGYVIGESNGGETRWTIEFSKGATAGTVTIVAADVSITQSVVELNLA